MSNSSEEGRLDRLYPEGEPQPLIVAHQGLIYNGEVILLNRWNATWDSPFRKTYTSTSSCFGTGPRCLQARSWTRGSPSAFPAKGLPGGRGHVARDLASLRETQALYITQRAPESAYMHSYLEGRRGELESRLGEEEAARYSGGNIVSPTVLGEDIGRFLSGPEPSAWFQNIAGVLLSWAYPALPLDFSLMPGPLEAQDIPALYEAIFASTEEARAPLANFGPALGLSNPRRLCF